MKVVNLLTMTMVAAFVAGVEVVGSEISPAGADPITLEQRYNDARYERYAIDEQLSTSSEYLEECRGKLLMTSSERERLEVEVKTGEASKTQLEEAKQKERKRARLEK
ncbi:MAG: hypothetical protein LBG13_00655 [Holosporales bacterium]|jgi:hypothetical protein|nr:hypothetical protein [Holosporales bacterium]